MRKLVTVFFLFTGFIGYANNKDTEATFKDSSHTLDFCCDREVNNSASAHDMPEHTAAQIVAETLAPAESFHPIMSPTPKGTGVGVK